MRMPESPSAFTLPTIVSIAPSVGPSSSQTTSRISGVVETMVTWAEWSKKTVSADAARTSRPVRFRRWYQIMS